MAYKLLIKENIPSSNIVQTNNTCFNYISYSQFEYVNN